MTSNDNGDGSLTRASLSEAVHREVGLSNTDSSELVRSVLDNIAKSLINHETVKLTGFGTFMVRSKKARIGRNPKTKEEVMITPRSVVVFRPSNIMKSNVNNKLEG